jgi:hypothetical protein
MNLGPICLLLGLLAALLKYAEPLWPLIAVICAGFFLVWKGKKNGYLFSLLLLGAAVFAVRREAGMLFPALLSSAAALSWLLMLLGDRELQGLIQKQREESAALQNDKEEAIAQMQAQMKENEDWARKHEQLALEMASCQHALEEAQAQLLIYKQTPTPAIIPQQEEEDKSLHWLQIQHAQLKEQFDEKSEVLHQTRKELFSLESQYLHLQREQQERACSFSEEDAAALRCIQQLQQECQNLRDEILALQDLVSLLLQPKKASLSRKRKNAKAAQEDLFLMMK